MEAARRGRTDLTESNGGRIKRFVGVGGETHDGSVDLEFAMERGVNDSRNVRSVPHCAFRSVHMK